MSALQVIWFLLIGVLLTAFAILDGFDLGVGFWHLRAKSDKERRTLLNAVGPFWDGNEVWLLTGAGAIFAAFPPVYASVFSGFYIAMMLVIVMLIGRAISLEFRSKEESPLWRSTWDVIFSITSVVVTILFGVALGNVIRGIPLDAAGNYTGTFIALLNPYALLIGIAGLSMFAHHGARFIVLKADGELGKRALSWAYGSGVAYLAMFIVTGSLTFVMEPQLLTNYWAAPVVWVIPMLTFAAIVASIVLGKKNAPGKSFIASAISIAGMMGIVGVNLFPNMVPSLGDTSHSLTIANSSSSELTLTVMLILACIGVPLVLGYTIWAYRTFAGKIDLKDIGNHY